MYKPPSRQSAQPEEVVCFANVKETVVTNTKYVSPSNRGAKAKTFDELFPSLGSGTVSLKLNRPGPICEEKKDDSNTPKSFAERIRQKLDKEREELEKKKLRTQAEEEDDDGYQIIVPNFTKYHKAVEATRLRKLKEHELRNKIFESETEDELEEELEEEIDELYHLDDDEDDEENDAYDNNEHDRQN